MTYTYIYIPHAYMFLYVYVSYIDPSKLRAKVMIL